MPGDIITVHPGTYRERVSPPRGGTSRDCRIIYRAAVPGQAIIKGSERIIGWTRSGETGVWLVRVPNIFFGDFNPYLEPLRGHWFIDNGRHHSRGAVYLNGHWLTEATSSEIPGSNHGGPLLWHAETNETHTTFRVEFGDVNPNEACVEINVRESVFYPSRQGCDYISVEGFVLEQASTPWSPPTTEQIGLLGTNWSKGWLIENNTVRYSVCAGITLGKYHDPLDFPERNIVEGTGGEDTYHGTIRRALEYGWRIDSVGNHTVRNNTVSHCEMAGICGSLGAVRCVIENNTIHDIHVRRLFKGFEQAGIKFHGAIDTRIAGNRIFRCNRGLWLDWMSQGTRVTCNLFFNNGPDEDIFTEVNHGPFVIDNNLLLSPRSITSWSEGGAYVHNLILGCFNARAEHGRITPYHPAHSTTVVDMTKIGLGDDKIINNILVDSKGLSDYDKADRPVMIEGNLYLGEARQSIHDRNPAHLPDIKSPPPLVVETAGQLNIESKAIQTLAQTFPTAVVTAARLGRAQVPDLPYEEADGQPVSFDYDFAGQPRKDSNTIPGPFSL